MGGVLGCRQVRAARELWSGVGVSDHLSESFDGGKRSDDPPTEVVGPYPGLTAARLAGCVVDGFADLGGRRVRIPGLHVCH